MIATSSQPGISLTYLKQGSELVGDAGDQYNGLDRFGRVQDQRWIKSSADIERVQYGYSLAGQKQWRHDPVAAALGKKQDERTTRPSRACLRFTRRAGFMIQLDWACHPGFVCPDDHGLGRFPLLVVAPVGLEQDGVDLGGVDGLGAKGAEILDGIFSASRVPSVALCRLPRVRVPAG